MTINEVKEVVSEYADYVAAQLRLAKGTESIKEYAGKLKISERIIKAIDSGELKINA